MAPVLVGADFMQGSDMAGNKPEPHGEFRVLLPFSTVCRLRELAARESMVAKKTVTWQQLLRAAADKAAQEDDN